MPLRHRYFICRHGESEANVEGVISSNPDFAVTNHGLSPLGFEQADKAAQQFFDIVNEASHMPVHILSSDFKRARETAGAIGGLLQVALRIHAAEHPFLQDDQVFTIDERLRERSFGDFEGKSNENYKNVWEEDAKSSKHTTNNVESVLSVFKRTTSIVTELEDQDANPMEPSIILFVAHGDTLQILQTYFNDIPCEQHRSVAHLNTAELRELKDRYARAVESNLVGGDKGENLELEGEADDASKGETSAAEKEEPDDTSSETCDAKGRPKSSGRRPVAGEAGEAEEQ